MVFTRVKNCRAWVPCSTTITTTPHSRNRRANQAELRVGFVLLNQFTLVPVAGLLGETRNPPYWLLDALRDVHAANIPIIALCSASFVLVQAGLLDGRRCAVHFTLRDEFRERFPLSTMVIDKSYVDDRAIITCPGGTAIDLAANLIRRRCGAVRAQKGLEYLLVDEQAEEEVDKAASDSVYQNDRVQRTIALHARQPRCVDDAQGVGRSGWHPPAAIAP